MIILGIDPGLATTGYGLIEKNGSKISHIESGIISTPPHTPLAQRLKTISKTLTTIITLFSPKVVAVEELFFNNNAKTAMLVGQARGVILLTTANFELDIVDYTPLQIKSDICGYGKAEKKQVQYMVKKLLNLSCVPKPDDAADALAIAICHSHNHKLKSYT